MQQWSKPIVTSCKLRMPTHQNKGSIVHFIVGSFHSLFFLHYKLILGYYFIIWPYPISLILLIPIILSFEYIGIWVTVKIKKYIPKILFLCSIFQSRYIRYESILQYWYNTKSVLFKSLIDNISIFLIRTCIKY